MKHGWIFLIITLTWSGCKMNDDDDAGVTEGETLITIKKIDQFDFNGAEAMVYLTDDQGNPLVTQLLKQGDTNVEIKSMSDYGLFFNVFIINVIRLRGNSVHVFVEGYTQILPGESWELPNRVYLSPRIPMDTTVFEFNLGSNPDLSRVNSFVDHSVSNGFGEIWNYESTYDLMGDQVISGDLIKFQDESNKLLVVAEGEIPRYTWLEGFGFQEKTILTDNNLVPFDMTLQYEFWSTNYEYKIVGYDLDVNSDISPRSGYTMAHLRSGSNEDRVTFDIGYLDGFDYYRVTYQVYEDLDEGIWSYERFGPEISGFMEINPGESHVQINSKQPNQLDFEATRNYDYFILNSGRPGPPGPSGVRVSYQIYGPPSEGMIVPIRKAPVELRQVSQAAFDFLNGALEQPAAHLDFVTEVDWIDVEKEPYQAIIDKRFHDYDPYARVERWMVEIW